MSGWRSLMAVVVLGVACDGAAGMGETDSGDSDGVTESGGDTDSTEDTDAETVDTDVSESDDGDEGDVSETCAAQQLYVDCVRRGENSFGVRDQTYFDSMGRMTRQTSGNSSSTWEYTDDLLTEYTLVNGNGTFVTSYTYDAAGKLVSSSDGWSYTYDAMGREISREQDIQGDGDLDQSCTRDWEPEDASVTYVESCTIYNVGSVNVIDKAVVLDPTTGLMLSAVATFDGLSSEQTTTYTWTDDCQPLTEREVTSRSTFTKNWFYDDDGRLITTEDMRAVRWDYTYDCDSSDETPVETSP